MRDNKVIRAMKGDDDGYKYLGVLEVDDIKQTETKQNVQKEYFRRVRKILKSKLNGGNIIKAINARAVSVIRYSAGIIDWTKEELQIMNRKTRKLLTIYRLAAFTSTCRQVILEKIGGRKRDNQY